MSTSRISNERGMALAVAIFALVVIGALVAGTFFAGRLEQSSGQATVYASQAAEAAEAGLIDAIETQLQASTLDAMAVNNVTTLTTLSMGAGTRTSATRSVRKLTSSLFLVEALGTRWDGVGASMSDRRLGTLIRLDQANITVSAGLTAIGRIVVGGNSTVSGEDATPSEWTAAGVSCPPMDTVAGVRYNGTVQQQGSATITGDPNRLNDNTLNASNIFGGSDFNTLKQLATLILSGNVSGLAPATTGTPPKCDASVESNWGAPTDPASPCFNYFPIIYHYGDLSISGSGAGQGILLVEGNLQVQGRIDFYGPVIVSGAVNIRGTGSDDVKFYGGVLAQDVTLDDSRLTGNATVNYSSCAIRRALRGSAIPEALSERSWVQLYN
jgi:Tfp pilus assembly protein PilX